MFSTVFKMLTIEVVISELATSVLVFSRIMHSSSNTVAPVEITIVTKARRNDSFFLLAIDLTVKHPLQLGRMNKLELRTVGNSSK